MFKHICIGFVLGLALMAPYLLVKGEKAGPVCFEAGRFFGGFEQLYNEQSINGDVITKAAQDRIAAGAPAYCR